ncbi:vWA domain-containing protein [Pseudactinotalea sp. Z1748]|uniref:vWA domain-containing protein n=1 Tax=Pseudactinotalea sp. Z1748 TaxID=3413027 RepID=UPI003C7A7F8B
MTMHPWAIAAVVLAVVILGILGWFARRRPTEHQDVRWVANAGYLTTLRSYRSRLSRYRTALGFMGVLLLGATVLTGILAARPVERDLRAEEMAYRDIVLCLDVSGSMIEYGTEIAEKFLTMLPEFEGERIALSIWNSTSRTVFPLTDDYDLVEAELTEAAEALDFDIYSPIDNLNSAKVDRLIRFITGTEGGTGDASSLIGDGLASCALNFDEADTERSRTIILAGDNEVFGEGVFTLDEAVDLVHERDITLHGIYAPTTNPRQAEEEAEYREAVERHGGLFYHASDADAVPRIIDEISAQQAVDLDATPEVIVTDTPERYFGILVVLLVLYQLGVWRLRS